MQLELTVDGVNNLTDQAVKKVIIKCKLVEMSRKFSDPAIEIREEYFVSLNNTTHSLESVFSSSSTETLMYSRVAGAIGS